MSVAEAALLAWAERVLPAGVVVAFSGGVDSAVLLAALARARGECTAPLWAVTFVSPLHRPQEVVEAEAQARQLGVPFRKLAVDPLADAALVQNPPERCYLCKRRLFEHLRDFACVAGCAWVVDGTHRDDFGTWRPGLRALRELGIASPLAELKLGKGDVRAVAAAWGLSVAQRPSAPCLATRFPYGTRLTREGLVRVAAGEEAVAALLPGVAPLRLRVHDDLARIEVPLADFLRVLSVREALVQRLREVGFRHVTLDLAGFRSGSFDEAGRQA